MVGKYNEIGNKITDKAVDIFIYSIAIMSILVCILPFVHEIAISLSSNEAIISQKVGLLPVGMTFLYYSNVIKDVSMLRSFAFTVFLTVSFTGICLAMSILAAYPLSKKHLKGRTFFFLVVLITMYFNGGMIPTYILIKDLHLINKVWALILPGMLSAFNLIVLKTFFTNSIPDELEEAAELDGCSQTGFLLRIVLPLSKPVLAVLALYYAVARWNGFTDVVLYIDNSNLYTLQFKLLQIIRSNMPPSPGTLDQEFVIQMNPDGIKAASVIFVTLPIVLVYPWLQKYFVKGVMIGAIKG